MCWVYPSLLLCSVRPVAQLQPNALYVASPHHALLRVPVPFSLAGSFCCGCVRSGWGWLLAVQTYGLCPSQGMHSYCSGSGGSTVFPFGRHTLTKCWLGYGSPAWDYGLPFAGTIWPFHLQNLSVVLSYDFVLLAPLSLPCLGRMGCVAGLMLGCLPFLVHVVSPSRWA